MIERAPLPYIAFAASAIGAAAAIWVAAVPTTSSPVPTYCPSEGPSVRATYEVERLVHERTELASTLDTAADRDAIARQLRAVDLRLADAQARLAEYRRAIAALDRRGPQPEPAPFTPGEPVNRALAAQAHDVDGCFHEWAERANHDDTKLVVTLVISEDGAGHEARAQLAEPASDVDGLPACVAPAIARIRFPAMPHDVDAIVTITWVARTLGFSTVVRPHVGHAPPR